MVRPPGAASCWLAAAGSCKSHRLQRSGGRKARSTPAAMWSVLQPIELGRPAPSTPILAPSAAPGDRQPHELAVLPAPPPVPWCRFPRRPDRQQDAQMRLLPVPLAGPESSPQTPSGPRAPCPDALAVCWAPSCGRAAAADPLLSLRNGNGGGWRCGMRANGWRCCFRSWSEGAGAPEAELALFVVFLGWNRFNAPRANAVRMAPEGCAGCPRRVLQADPQTSSHQRLRKLAATPQQDQLAALQPFPQRPSSGPLACNQQEIGGGGQAALRHLRPESLASSHAPPSQHQRRTPFCQRRSPTNRFNPRRPPARSPARGRASGPAASAAPSAR